MKSFGAAFVLVLSLVNCSQSYKLHSSGGYYNANNKRYNSQPKVPSAVYEPSSYYQQQYQPQQQQASSFYYDEVPNQNYPRSQPQPQQQQPQYLQYPSPSRGSGGSVLSDEYSSGSYYYPRQQADYQQPLYGIPTYRGDYQPKPYYFAAQPSYSSADDDHYETTNPLDYLHEEILEENERERTMNNAQFLQNLALYNKHVDSLKERQDQIRQMQDMYNLRSNEMDDYNMVDSPNDWYDQTSIVVDPETYESIRNNYNQRSAAVDYNDDEMVKELRGLSKQNHRKSSSALPKFKNEYQHDYPNDQEMEDEEDDTWINWSKKRSIQPKKDTVQQGKNKILSSSTQTPMAKSLSTTMSSIATSTIKLLSKINGAGQKEVVLPRPATPVRKPFSDSVMAAAINGNQQPSAKSTPPIYRTIKQIIDMEQNLSHLSNNELPTSKIRKRFVTNEEALVQQLNGLKRTSKK